LSNNLLDAIPDDPDAAMAWLEQLAARQGAPLDELPTVSEVSDDVAMPDWMTRDLEEFEREMQEAEAAEARAQAEAAAEAAARAEAATLAADAQAAPATEVPDLTDDFDADELDEIEDAAAETAAEVAAQAAAQAEMTTVADDRVAAERGAMDTSDTAPRESLPQAEPAGSEWSLEMRSHIEESLPDWLGIDLEEEPDELGLAWDQMGSDV